MSSPIFTFSHFPPFFSFFFFSHLRLNLSGDSNASGSPHLNRLDENVAAPPLVTDDRRNIGLVIDLLRLDEPPPTPLENLQLDSDSGKNPPRRLKNGDFIPL